MYTHKVCVHILLVRFTTIARAYLRSIQELYGRGKTYDEVHEQTRQSAALWSRYIPDTSFKFVVEGYNHTIPQRRQREVVETFAFMELEGKIEMKKPDITFSVFEECKHSHHVFKRHSTDLE